MFKTNVQHNEESQSKHLYNYLLDREIEYLQALPNPPSLGIPLWSQNPPSLRSNHYFDFCDNHFFTFFYSLLNNIYYTI